MAQQNHNSRRAPAAQSRAAVVALMLAAALGGCGRRASSSSAAFEAPDFLKSPQLSPVPAGSRDVVASPPSGFVRGTVLLKLFGEVDAKIRYAFRAFGEDAPTAALLEYTEGITLLPPVGVWAQAEKDGVRGPVRAFHYDFDPRFWPPPGLLAARRLPRLAP